jgi:hypothetical protein
MCQAALDGARVESAFLTTVGQVRRSPAVSGGYRRPLWPRVPSDELAAWCSVRTGQMVTLAAVTTQHRQIVFLRAAQPLNPGPGDPPTG